MRNIWRTKTYSIKNCLVLCLAFLFLFAAGMPSVSAHATLEKSVPEQGANLSVSPAQIELNFNERIEGNFFDIQVFDQARKNVAKAQVELSQNHKGLALPLPKLKDGVYTVSYHIISQDGHPIEDSYIFTVGQTSEQAEWGQESSDGEQGLETGIQSEDGLKYATRILHLFSLLFLVGFAAWGVISREFRRKLGQNYNGWLLQLQRIQFIALLLAIYFQLNDLLGEAGLDQIFTLFTGTKVGLLWLISLALSLLGFLVLGRSAWGDGLWISGMLAAKALNGHASAFEPIAGPVIMDFVHLLASALWAGGLLLLVLFWRKEKQAVSGWLPQFSRIALLSIIALVVTGSLMTLHFLSKNLTYLLYTTWGQILIAKVALVLLVIIVAALIRYRIRKKGASSVSGFVKVDVTLMVVIVILVGFLTYLSPMPPNEPLRWHVMGEEVHMSADITPNAPGNNEFAVKVWVPEGQQAPKQVVLKLHYQDDKGIAPIEVPLTLLPESGFDQFPGFEKFTYTQKGSYLPFAGEWLVEVRVLDANDDEHVYDKTMRIY